MIYLLTTQTPTVTETLEEYFGTQEKLPCSFCRNPTSGYKPVDFASDGLNFCNPDCEECFHILDSTMASPLKKLIQEAGY